jgi:DNA-3-methyladenine glycosylase
LRATEPVRLDFFARPARELAPDLLGCVLFHGDTAGMLVETEAYLGIDDLAAHASRGLTPRTKVIFGPPGRAYVYFIYGMHECLNVVADREGVPGCVLIRALEPLCGLEQMVVRRDWNGLSCGLSNGPGKLTQALDITNRHHELDLGGDPRHGFAPRETPMVDVVADARIGISRSAHYPWRFTLRGSPFVSRAVRL